VEVAGAAVAVSQAPQASLLLAAAVTAAKVCPPVSPALQASRLAAAYKSTYLRITCLIKATAVLTPEQQDHSFRRQNISIVPYSTCQLFSIAIRYYVL
jgi:hypothetical protein